MRRSSRQLAIVLVVASALLLACHGGDNPILPPFSGIRAVAGAGTTDTVNAVQKQALVVEVRDADGKVVQGAVVRFEAQPPSDTLRRNEPAIYVCSLSAPSCGGYYGSQFFTDTTDSEGRAKTIIRLGQVAGRAVVKLGVPELGLEDSATFTVTAGAPARVYFATSDTSLNIGQTATLAANVTDRYFNPRPELPTMSLGSGSAVTLDAGKGIVTAQDMGTQWVIARYGDMADSTSVRVIPPGRLVVWAAGAHELRLVNTDESGGSRLLLGSVGSDFGAFPHFDPSNRYVTSIRGSYGYGGSPNTIVVVDTATLAIREVGPALGFDVIVTARQRADGTLLAVGKRSTSTTYGLWSIASDNTVTLLADLPALQPVYDGADISQDGTKLAYLVTGSSEIRTLDVATGTTTTVTTAGRSPRWSPNGDRLAYLVPVGYLDGRLRIHNADGSEKIIDYLYSPGLAWSSDGAYVIGRSSESGFAGIRLVRVSDGAFVMLRYPSGYGWYEDYYQPDWR